MLAKRSTALRGEFVGDAVGLALFLLGGAIMVLATVRFRLTTLDIAAPDTRPGPGQRVDIAMMLLLGLLGAALFVYLAYTVISW